MALNPIPILAIVILTLVFEGLIIGNDIAAGSFPEFKSVNFGSCGGDFFETLGCLFGNLGAAFYNIFAAIFGGIFFFINLISFNVPGTPWFIRTILGTLIGGTILWCVVGMFRGN